MDESEISSRNGAKSGGGSVVNAVTEDKLINCFHHLSKGNLFRQHVAYNLRCVTSIIKNTSHPELRDHLVDIMVNCDGVRTLSLCINNIISASQQSKRAIDENDFQSISIICSILQFIVVSRKSTMTLIRECQIPSVLVSIIKHSSILQIEEISTAFSFLDILIPSDPLYFLNIEMFEVIYKKLSEVSFSMQLAFGCLQILSTAIELQDLSQTISNYLNDMLIIDKLNELVYSKTIFKDSENPAVKTLQLLLQLFKVDTTSMSSLVGIPFGIIIGRLLKFFPNSIEIPKYGGELLLIINRNHLTEIITELYTELSSAIESNDEKPLERILDALAGFTLIMEGRTLCLSIGITNQLLHTAKYKDRSITERSMAILLNIASDLEISSFMNKEIEMMDTAYQVMNKYTREAMRPAPDDSARIVTLALRLMNSVTNHLVRKSNPPTKKSSTSTAATGAGAVDRKEGALTLEISDSNCESDLSLILTKAAESLLNRPDLLTTSTALAESYLELMLHVVRNNPDLCTSKNHVRLISAAVIGSGAIDESTETRRRSLRSIIALFEEMGRHLAQAPQHRRLETLETLRGTAPTIAALLATDTAQDSVSPDFDMEAIETNERIIEAITGLVKESDSVGIGFIKSLLEYLPATRKRNSRKRLSVVLSELEKQVNTEELSQIHLMRENSAHVYQERASPHEDDHQHATTRHSSRAESRNQSVANEHEAGITSPLTSAITGHPTPSIAQFDSEHNNGESETVPPSQNTPPRHILTRHISSFHITPDSHLGETPEQSEELRDNSMLGSPKLDVEEEAVEVVDENHELVTNLDTPAVVLEDAFRETSNQQPNSLDSFSYRSPLDSCLSIFSEETTRASPPMGEGSRKRPVKASGQVVQHLKFLAGHVKSRLSGSSIASAEGGPPRSPTSDGGFPFGDDISTNDVGLTFPNEILSDLNALKRKAGLYSTQLLKSIDEISEYLRLSLFDRTSLSNNDQLEKHYEVLQDFYAKLTSKDYEREEDQDELIIAELITCLQNALNCLNEATSKLQFYSWQDSENSLSHNLEFTINMLKGEIFVLTQSSVPEYLKIIEMVSKSEQSCTAMFKQAHLEVKRAVIDIAGEQYHDTRWTLNDSLLGQMPDFKKASLLKSLRVLVVCFDNLPPLRKRNLVTASELVKNREWLVKLGRICITIEIEPKVETPAKRPPKSHSSSSPQMIPITPTNSTNRLVRKQSKYGLRP